mmetsp:Transcript_5260/g.14932  ORF Transcript_5260/g.14932 Transcript_5260/m.14932 type:complete len:261 (-) Transcript_5260:1270-2052(-)
MVAEKDTSQRRLRFGTAEVRRACSEHPVAQWPPRGRWLLALGAPPPRQLFLHSRRRQSAAEARHARASVKVPEIPRGHRLSRDPRVAEVPPPCSEHLASRTLRQEKHQLGAKVRQRYARSLPEARGHQRPLVSMDRCHCGAMEVRLLPQAVPAEARTEARAPCPIDSSRSMWWCVGFSPAGRQQSRSGSSWRRCNPSRARQEAPGASIRCGNSAWLFSGHTVWGQLIGRTACGWNFPLEHLASGESSDWPTRSCSTLPRS